MSPGDMYLTFQRCHVFASLVSLRLSKDTKDAQRQTCRFPDWHGSGSPRTDSEPKLKSEPTQNLSGAPFWASDLNRKKSSV